MSSRPSSKLRPEQHLIPEQHPIKVWDVGFACDLELPSHSLEDRGLKNVNEMTRGTVAIGVLKRRTMKEVYYRGELQKPYSCNIVGTEYALETVMTAKYENREGRPCARFENWSRDPYRTAMGMPPQLKRATCCLDQSGELECS